MEPFVITRAHIEQMIATMESGVLDGNLGACSYSAPCVIGSVMPKELIVHLVEQEYNGANVNTLVDNGFVKYGDDIDNGPLQCAQYSFDCKDRDDVISYLKESIGVD